MLLNLQPADGRDIIIGDLHGRRDLLDRLLDHLNFDPVADRVVSVGDLIDRGPQSLECLRLLREPWFKCVLANHEQMALWRLTNTMYPASWMPNGGAWAIQMLNVWDRAEGTTPEEKLRRAAFMEEEHFEIADLILNHVSQLPYLINIEYEKPVHIIHAELPAGKRVGAWEPVIDHLPRPTIENLRDPAVVVELARYQVPRDSDAFCWQRCLFHDFYMQPLSNLDKAARTAEYVTRTEKHLYNPDTQGTFVSGHTIVMQPLQVLNAIDIDTGAFFEGDRSWAGLTAFTPHDWRFYTARQSGISFPSVQRLTCR